MSAGGRICCVNPNTFQSATQISRNAGCLAAAAAAAAAARKMRPVVTSGSLQNVSDILGLNFAFRLLLIDSVRLVLRCVV